jgi:hypothetical protein
MTNTQIQNIAESILFECVDHDNAFELFLTALHEATDKRQLVEGFVNNGYDYIVPDNILDRYGLYDQVYSD